MKLKITLKLLTCALFLSQNLLAQTPTFYDVVPGSTSSYPYDKIEIGNRLYFAYEEPLTDEYVIGYLSEDGEINQPFYNLPSGIEINDVYSEIVNLNSKPYWIQRFYDSNTNSSIYTLCEIINDTVQLILQPNLELYDLVAYNNNIYMTGYTDTTQTAIFKYDGSSITIDFNLVPASTSAYAQNLQLLNSKMYFYTNDNSNGNKYFVEFDGTTYQYDTLNINTYYPLNFLKNKNDSIYFVTQGSYGYRLNLWYGGALSIIPFPHYVYDAQIVGDNLYYCTYNVQNIVKYNLNTGVSVTIPGSIPYYTYNLTLFQNKIYFSTNLDNSNNYYELCYIDPAIDTANYIVIPNQSEYIYDITVVGNELYFTCGTNDIINGDTGVEPFRLNNGNPMLIADLNTNTGNNNDSNPYEFMSFLGNLAMSASKPSTGDEIVIMCTNNTIPTAPASQILCENSNVTDLQANGSDLIWYDADTLGNVIGVNQPITQSDTYYVATRLVCPGDRIAVPFTISMLPNNIAAYYGDSIIKVVYPTDAYQWMDCGTGNPINGATSQSFQAQMNGSYKCLLTNADGCSSTTNCVYLVNLSVVENLKNSVKVYPNPATDYVNFQSDENMDRITVTSLSGQILQEEKVGELTYTLDVNQFTSGIYLMLIYDTNNNLISKQKIVVNK